MTVEDGIGQVYSGIVIPDSEGRSRIVFQRQVVTGYYGLRASMPEVDALLSLEPDFGPAGILLSSGKPGSTAYHPIDLGGIAGFVQVTAPVWFNHDWLTAPFHRGERQAWRELIDEIDQLAQAERHELQTQLALLESELAFLQTLPETTLLRRLLSRLASLRLFRSKSKQ